MSTRNAPSADSGSATTAVRVLLTTELAVRLDQLSVGIRRITGKRISRSALIRAFTHALLPYGVSFQDCESELQISQKITQTIELALRNPHSAR